ncbi:MAG TPA: PQQ-dependent sugar dehydrogenase, partial [Cytophagales bacterium]|nr:PQQ-dependent sugar dehydrogenase [Cytophagales bacterium]
SFNSNHYFYVAYSYEKSKNPLVINNKIVRYREDPATKKPIFDKILIDHIEGYINHNVGSLHFGPDDKLYVTTGERYLPEYAQDMTKLNGKILRVNRDGSVPSDNPFPESLIYTLGHRNVQGLAWQPNTNNLFNVEHGPSLTQGCCMDEINFIQPGKNYGWPLIRGKQQAANMETPRYISGDDTTWAPAQAIFLTEGPWKGSMLFTGLFDQALHRAIFDSNDPTKVVKVETYMKEELGRLRAIAKGPDGRIYLGTSNGDGRGIAKSPKDDRIFILNIQPK